MSSSWFEGVPGTHQWYDGTPIRGTSGTSGTRPSLTDVDTVYAGVEDAALFRSTDGGNRQTEVAGLRQHGTDSTGNRKRAACVCTRSCSTPATRRDLHRYLGCGRFPQRRCQHRLAAYQPRTEVRVHSRPGREVGHCVHHVALHPARPNVLFMQKHWDVMRSDNAGDSWYMKSGQSADRLHFVVDVPLAPDQTPSTWCQSKSDSDITRWM